MPLSSRPSFALSRWTSAADGDDGWTAWQARVDAGLTGPRIDPAIVAAVRANEAVVLGRPARATDRAGTVSLPA